MSLAEGSGDSGRMLTVRSTSRRRDVAALNISLPDGVGRGRANGLARGINGPEDPEELPVAAFCAQHGGTTCDRGSEAADAEGDQRANRSFGAATTGEKDVRCAGRSARNAGQDTAQGAKVPEGAVQDGAASQKEHGGLQRRAILVRPEQVHEFDAYVQLCEKVARRMRRRSVPMGGFAESRELQEAGACEGAGMYEEAGGLPAFEDEAEAKQRAKEARQLARRVELWQTLVCFSAFRQSETGSSVNVFDPPADCVGR